MEDAKNDFAALAETIRETMEPTTITFDGSPGEGAEVLLVPKGMEVYSVRKYLDEYRMKPERRTGTISADTLGSFVDITNRFKSSNSVVFGRCKVEENKIEASLLAIFNYHPPTPENTDAAFIDHRAVYKFPIGKDFGVWIGNNRKPMSQIDFAHFLEERIMDLASPTKADAQLIENLKPVFAEPTDILELSRSLEVYSKETVKQKVKLASGETEIKFTCEHVDADGKPVKIPDFFILHLPIFDGGEYHRIIVRLRYRAREGSVVWFYDLYRIDRVFEEAFDKACKGVAESTALPVYIGQPENGGSGR